jgi:hypothetical protein
MTHIDVKGELKLVFDDAAQALHVDGARTVQLATQGHKRAHCHDWEMWFEQSKIEKQAGYGGWNIHKMSGS